MDAAVVERDAIRKSLNNDSEFQPRNKAVVDALRAMKDYEHKAAPKVAELEAASKAYIDTLKSSNSK